MKGNCFKNWLIIIHSKAKKRETEPTTISSIILEYNSSLKFEITAKRLYAASQRVL